MLSRWRTRGRPLRWSVVTSAPKGEAGDQWGDTHFAADLVDALARAGQEASVVARPGAEAAAREQDDVVVVLRGLRRVRPRRGGATWLLWVISHPELVEADEPADFDACFAASAHWTRHFDVPVQPLLQATNPRRFRPDAAIPDTGPAVLFVGSTRGEFRPAVREALAAGFDVAVFGVGWEAYLPPERIAGQFVANADLPAAYAAAGIVLNDHWPDMAAEGFLSNRLFDATAVGARVLTDAATGLADAFGGEVRSFSSGAQLAEILGAGPDAFPDRASRLALAQRVAREHSFDARAAVLIERARSMRGEAG
ncbi:MAG: glycosyltransferase [Actinomycetota bacterium]|nr:glycosyltransferase [Actinomycetota bacterium]